MLCVDKVFEEVVQKQPAGRELKSDWSFKWLSQNIFLVMLRAEKSH